MSPIRVGVVRGGPSDEYDVSLESGAAVLRSLAHEKFDGKYQPRDILISKDGVWHISGVPIEPTKAFGHTDVFVNALHGRYGEDGSFQVLFDQHGVAYTGSRSLASAVAMNKALTKKIFKQHGIKTPQYIVVEIEDLSHEKHREEIEKKIKKKVDEIFHTFSLPVVVKPCSNGSSIGVSIVRTFSELEPAMLKAFAHSTAHTGSILVEEFIPGREASVGIIDHFRGEELYALPVVEIRHNGDFFDYEAKYSDKEKRDDTKNESTTAEEIVPGHFSAEEKSSLYALARSIHTALGLRHYSRSDFIVSPRRGIYALEVNTLPGLTKASLVPKALASVGADLPDFLDHIIGLALAGK